MSESTQHKLDRVRSPRVQITYDVEVGDASQQKELPFVVGVLADLSGKPSQPLPRLKDRKFVEIDRDNFNDVMAGIKPRVAVQVNNRLTNNDSKIAVELNFKHMDDFQPDRVAEQIDPLKKLLEARRKLSDLLAKMDGNDALIDRLDEIIRDTEKLSTIRKAVNRGEPGT